MKNSTNILLANRGAELTAAREIFVKGFPLVDYDLSAQNRNGALDRRAPLTN